MSAPRGPARGRGRGRGRGGFFQQQENDGDMAMSDTGNFASRGRGRGYRGGQNFQNNQQHVTEADQAMRDTNNFQPRGRGRGRGRPFQQYQHPHSQAANGNEREQAKSETVQLLEGFLARRYDQSNKLLNLSAIATDEEVQKAGMFDSESTQKKFFPALMVICDQMLPERHQKIEAIESVSLSNNNVPNLNAIYELVKYMNHIKNLDLSGNKFANLGSIKPWKNRYKFLEHLIIDPFPEPNWETELLDWYPSLRILNGKQVRPDPNTPAIAVAGAPMNNLGGPVNTPPVPANTPMAPVDAEQQQKEEMVVFVQKATNLKRDYAIQCLEAGQWNLEKASDMFMQAKATLPPEAYN